MIVCCTAATHLRQSFKVADAEVFAITVPTHFHTFWPKPTQQLSVAQLLRTSHDKPLNGQPLWERSDLDRKQLVREFQKECHVVRRSIDGDLVKV